MASVLFGSPRLMLAAAAGSVAATFMGAMFILAAMRMPEEWIMLVAPTPSLVVAGIFLYLGRNLSNNRRDPIAADLFEITPTPDPIEERNEENHSLAPVRIPTGDYLYSSTDLQETQNGDLSDPSADPYSTELSSEGGAPEFRVQPNASSQRESEQPLEPRNPFMSVEATPPEESASDTLKEVESAAVEAPPDPVNKVLQELEKKIEQQAMVVSTESQVVAETPTAESMEVVDRSKQQITKKIEQRCIVIAAPSHGVLQDRLNNWLSGGYGRVISASMAINGKGFYLTLFYEPLGE